MSLAGALSGQFGMVDETTFATAATVTRFLEVGGEGLQRTIGRVESKGMRPSRRVLRSNQWTAGREDVSGDLEFDVQTNGFALLLKHMLGEKVEFKQPNAGSFPTVYEGKYRIGALDGKSFTCQTAVGDTGGTVRAYTYAGCKVEKWELMCDENGILKLKVSVDGVSESISVALASASYASGSVPLYYTGAVIKLGGAEVPVKKFTLACDNGLARERYAMKGTTPTQKREQLESVIRPITGTMDVEFESLSLYEKFTKSEEATAEANFQGATIAGAFKYGLKVDLEGVRLDGKGPDITGEGLVDVTYPFTAVDTGGANSPVQMTYTTTDTAE